MGDKLKVYSHVPESTELSSPDHLFVIDRKDGLILTNLSKLSFILKL